MKWFFRGTIAALVIVLGFCSYIVYDNYTKGHHESAQKTVEIPQKIENSEIINKPVVLPLLVNRSNALDSNYIPKNLTVVKARLSPRIMSESRMMDADAAAALEELFKEADNENVKLYCISGYRSYATQKAIYESKVRAAGKAEADKYVALPGQSEHQTGLAMDVGNESMINKSLEETFAQTKEGIWLKENAYKFGFILRYPKEKENITGFNFEPWHIRYVGKDVAEEINSKGIVLEEYISQNS